jgi:hypothetical protein
LYVALDSISGPLIGRKAKSTNQLWQDSDAEQDAHEGYLGWDLEKDAEHAERADWAEGEGGDFNTKVYQLDTEYC